MQFSIFTITVALAASVSAQYAATNGTSATSSSAVASAAVPYPTASSVPFPSASGTGSAVKPSGTGATVKPSSSSTAPFEGAAHQLTGSALGLIVAGGVALML